MSPLHWVAYNTDQALISLLLSHPDMDLQPTKVMAVDIAGIIEYKAGVEVFLMHAENIVVQNLYSEE